MSSQDVEISTDELSSILESEIAPALDRIIAEYGHQLRPDYLNTVKRLLDITEELFDTADMAFYAD